MVKAKSIYLKLAIASWNNVDSLCLNNHNYSLKKVPAIWAKKTRKCLKKYIANKHRISYLCVYIVSGIMCRNCTWNPQGAFNNFENIFLCGYVSNPLTKSI